MRSLKEIVSLSSKGQIVIPREVRERLGLKKGDLLEMELEGELIKLKLLSKSKNLKNWKSLRGLLKGKYSTREFLTDRAEERKREFCK
ncbi:AbrB/MazE/SpoVT family DNA-binding domain-containing protein [Thermosulfurimonas marina]|uniref:AbrB/MazE/SpoVT family DNA-binding domain-containing protein n=1 Tax=Thermosulfurimonas marina TaxID=2047767 RepID=A0A6H1WT25_9BACT|nr:AbrB/MazE/SpoVT family DNA-binding domain-containing protein [Thermosulfurimonas marina]QJA06304.1 AbrB/MazE/SpoVT family DNA-binding domain-containing protein [Thermosulfurimonas marina]